MQLNTIHVDVERAAIGNVRGSQVRDATVDEFCNIAGVGIDPNNSSLLEKNLPLAKTKPSLELNAKYDIIINPRSVRQMLDYRHSVSNPGDL